MFHASEDEFRSLFDSRDDMKDCLAEFWDSWYDTTGNDPDNKTAKVYNYTRKMKMGCYGIEVYMFGQQWATFRRNEKRWRLQNREAKDRVRELEFANEELKNIIDKFQIKNPEPDYDSIFDDESEEGAGVGLESSPQEEVKFLEKYTNKRIDKQKEDKERNKKLYG